MFDGAIVRIRRVSLFAKNNESQPLQFRAGDERDPAGPAMFNPHLRDLPSLCKQVVS